MKSKNMTLMVVAIGCGLVAAFLTAKLSGGSGPEMVDVIVAQKELTVGTTLDEKEISNMIGTKKYPKDSLPPDVVLNVEELKGKRLNRTLKQGNYFSQGDVSPDSGIKLPEGMSKYSVKMDGVRAVTGFVQPGDHVDIILTESQASGKAKSGVILRDMLVLAMDTRSNRAEGNQQGAQTINSVSLAVTPKQALILSSAEKRGEVKLLLRDNKSTDKLDVEASDSIPGFDDKVKTAQGPNGAKTIGILVAKKEVPVNTFVTADNFEEFFTTKDIPEEAFFGKSVKDPNTLYGKYIANKMEADMPVYTSWVSEQKIEVGGKTVAIEIDQDKHELLPWPKQIAEEKPLYPRKFEQILNNQRVWFLEVAPGEYRRVDGDGGVDLKDVPATNGKKEEKAIETSGDRAY